MIRISGIVTFPPNPTFHIVWHFWAVSQIAQEPVVGQTVQRAGELPLSLPTFHVHTHSLRARGITVAYSLQYSSNSRLVAASHRQLPFPSDRRLPPEGKINRTCEAWRVEEDENGQQRGMAPGKGGHLRWGGALLQRAAVGKAS